MNMKISMHGICIDLEKKEYFFFVQCITSEAIPCLRKERARRITKDTSETAKKVSYTKNLCMHC